MSEPVTSRRGGAVGAAALVQHAQALGELLGDFDGRAPDADSTDDEAAGLVTLLRALEELKCRAEGAQVMASVALDAHQRAVQAAAGVPAQRRGVGVGLQVGLARRESHHRGRQHLGLAKILVAELPGTLGALRAGRINEWRATLIARETACLSREHRTLVDEKLCAGAGLTGWGDGELLAQLRALAYRLDPAAVVARRAHAQGRRGVWVRPAPDTMTYLTALLPVTEGVGVFAALTRAADTARAGGDPRSRGQVMADLLVTRVLGQADGDTAQIPVTINVVVSDQVLLAEPDEAGSAHPGEGAFVPGYGPVPPSLARELATAPTKNEGGRAMVALRRLYARPADGALVAMDSTARCFPAGLAQLIRFRDRTCRTPWCDAPIRHIDHTQPADQGGPTSLSNGQGMCEACNHAKQAPGFSQHVRADHPHEVVTTTPTGHTYTSTGPPAPRPADLSPPARPEVIIEVDLHYWHRAA